MCDIMRHPELQRGITDVLALGRLELKARSNLGYVFTGGKQIHLGNYAHTA